MVDGRPVLTREQTLALSKKIMAMSASDDVRVYISHSVRSVTELATDRVRKVDDGEMFRVGIFVNFPDELGLEYIETNQLDEQSLRELVARADALNAAIPTRHEKWGLPWWDEQDSYPPVKLWHEPTINALNGAKNGIIPSIVDTVRKGQCHASGFIGIVAKANAVLTHAGITAFCEETDSEVCVTARPGDASTTGWSGVAARDWSTIDPVRVAHEATEISLRNQHPQAVEPGRRTAILGPAAVVQLMRWFVLHLDGDPSDRGLRAFSKVANQEKGSRWHEHMFDPRVKVTSDPMDPAGGFRPWFANGLVSHPTTWVADSALKYLAYGSGSLAHGKPYAELPFGARLEGGTTTLEQMIAQCEEGIYVNRFSSVDNVDWHSGLLTGVTRDGCFLVKHGKIDRAVKNFRFLTSPFFVFNNIIAVGPTERAAYGYTPWTRTEKFSIPWDVFGEEFFEWPRRPMIVPPLMVRDFNFNALIDAV